MSELTVSSKGQDQTPAFLLNQFRIKDSELKLVGKFGAKIKPSLRDFVEEFYTWLTVQPFFNNFFADETQVEKVKQMQIEYWNTFFDAKVDEAYIESRRKIGRVHARIELPLDIYLNGMSVFFENCVNFLSTSKDPSRQSQLTLLAISKLILLDEVIITNTYTEITNEKIYEQGKALIEMSTPVTSIWESILLLPLVGIIDSKRALDITARVLEEIVNSQATRFILDISGVAVMDTAVANYLIKITKATNLMGCESIISGLSPAIAQTIVDLGIDVGSLKTTGNLRDALKQAIVSLESTEASSLSLRR